jgi:putative nucleotidyltransferase with HDIG domain
MTNITNIANAKLDLHKPPLLSLNITKQIYDRQSRPFIAVGILVLQLASSLTVYVAGGTLTVYPQLMYLPVILAGLVFGLFGGLSAAILGGLLIGPWMPLNVEQNIPQATLSWMIRMAFFVLNGGVAGGLSVLLQQRLNFSEAISEQLSLMYGRSLRTLALLLAERDQKTGDHSDQVAYNAHIMGIHLKLPQEEREALYWAAILHDLGKIGVSENILNKPGPLTPEERTDMQRHAEIGYRMLRTASPEFIQVAEYVYSHHERFDGTGYPRKLEGENIPLGGRILAVLDVFEALTSQRPYREPMPTAMALEYLGQESGKHFDPALVKLFTELYHGGQIAISGEKVEHMHELYLQYDTKAMLVKLL